MKILQKISFPFCEFIESALKILKATNSDVKIDFEIEEY